MPTITQLFSAFVGWLPSWLGIIFIVFFAFMAAILVLKVIMFLLQLKFW